MMFRTSNEEEVRHFTSHTYDIISMIDDSVGEILAALDPHGLTDGTIIVNISDHVR